MEKNKTVGNAMYDCGIYRIVMEHDVRGGVSLTAYRRPEDELCHRGFSTILLPNQRLTAKIVMYLANGLSKRGW
jgi:hypothetical protein